MMDMETQDHYSACNDDSSGTGKRRSLHKAVTSRMEASSSSSPQQSTSHTVLPTTAMTTTTKAGQEQKQPHQKEQKEEEQTQPREYTIPFFPRDQNAWVRTLMTSLLGLLLFGLVMSLIVMPHYALVIILFWLVIMSAFSGLACILQKELQRKDSNGYGGYGGVFHPILHAMARAVVDEMEALQDEWRQEILLIKADESSSATSSTTRYASVDKNGQPVATQHYSVPFPRPKKKSKLFRIFVKPFLRGGRSSNNSKKRNNNSSSRSKASPVAATIPVSGGGGGGRDYVVPPVSSLV